MLRTNGYTSKPDEALQFVRGWNEALVTVMENLAVMHLELADRVVELEKQKQPQLKYFGVWSADVEYSEGAIVTHQGSAHHANIKCKGVVPGTSAAWSLMVKGGGTRNENPCASESAVGRGFGRMWRKGHHANLAQVEAVLCEDFISVMLYVPDGVGWWLARYFHLPAPVSEIDAAAVERELLELGLSENPVSATVH